ACTTQDGVRVVYQRWLPTGAVIGLQSCVRGTWLAGLREKGVQVPKWVFTSNAAASGEPIAKESNCWHAAIAAGPAQQWFMSFDSYDGDYDIHLRTVPPRGNEGAYAVAQSSKY